MLAGSNPATGFSLCQEAGTRPIGPCDSNRWKTSVPSSMKKVARNSSFFIGRHIHPGGNHHERELALRGFRIDLHPHAGDAELLTD